jgi:phosphoglucosamine mutase
MTRKYFGTDGIRGRANAYPMTAEIALKVGMAAGLEFRQHGRRNKVIIAKDTRLSGYMIEPALTAGFVAVGMDVILVGPMPTPAVALLARSMRADLGVMISASHNSFEDNGIKLFAPDGSKLSDEREHAIEARIDSVAMTGLAEASRLGRAKRIDDAVGRYIEFVKSTFPRNLSLDKLRIVIDCANGAAYKIAPTVLYELGAEVVAIGNEPNGLNINKDCGSTHPEAMCRKVIETRADLGIALDGDADRLVMCDERGVMLDGDQLLALIASYWHKQGRLKEGKLVATHMSNLGMERALAAQGIELVRTQVGDRYVIEAMREHGSNLGGEQSGHIVCRDYNTTGDGLVAALQVLAVMLETNQPLSECGKVFTPVPQVLKNVVFKGSNPLDSQDVQDTITRVQGDLGARGRVFIRKSGTEPKIRVMVEAEDDVLTHRIADELVDAIRHKVS